ncbi:gliding motility-associated C-terminal domain-containing protein [Fluviicola sp.]|uniref:gliding motility-associated C-terminal domain-containing protein n=1 Tax=Fluviicola sp. TaxID=1917219 RepID=UPI0031D5779D
MKNKIVLYHLLFLCSVFNLSAQSHCQNIDFEDGDSSGWISQGNVEIVNKGQTDFYGNFPLASSGFFAVKLGSREESNLSTIKRSIYIDSSTKYFIYSYAVVLLGVDHSESEAARVEVHVTDSSGQVIPCTHFVAIAKPQISDGYQESDSMYWNLPVFYRPWATNAIDLSPYIGQTLNIELVNKWCVYDVHFGYSYIDAYCTSQLINTFSSCTNQKYYIRCIDGFEEYVWSGPGIVGGLGTNLVEVNQPGLYTVDIPNPSFGCDSIHLEINVTLNEVPDLPEANFSLSSVCLGDTATLFGQTTTINPIQDQSWVINGVHVGSNFTEHLPLDEVDEYTITYSVTNESGCSDSITKTFTVREIPALELGDAKKICPGEPLKLYNLANSSATLTWNTGEIASFIEVDTQGVYYVMAYDGFCTNTDSVKVDFGSMHLGNVPNIFTPNHDLINDEFVIESENLTGYHLEIVNRWGNTVFVSDHPGVYWNGTVNGEVVNDGVYYYILEYLCEESKLKRSGFVQVQR